MTIILVIMALLISVSATYNAYLLRGGKLALSEVLIALGMISFVISFVLRLGFFDLTIAAFPTADLFFILGFVLLLVASFRLRASLK